MAAAGFLAAPGGFAIYRASHDDYDESWPGIAVPVRAQHSTSWLDEPLLAVADSGCCAQARDCHDIPDGWSGLTEGHRRWDDGHEGLVFPGPDAEIQPTPPTSEA